MTARVPTWVLLVVCAACVGAALERALHRETPRDVAARFRERFADATNSHGRAFEEVTQALGIEFVHDADARGNFYLPEEMGPGVGLLDFDGDGALDIFVAGGGSITGEGAEQRCRLFQNLGSHFVDVSARTGADLRGPAYGVACADYDDDGDVDIFVTRLGTNALLRNDGARFVDVAAEAGVAARGFGASAVFFDYDKDGALDLYVCNYIAWSREIERECQLAGVRDYCDPSLYAAPTSDWLYRNLGDGHFEDVSARAGITAAKGNGLGVVAEDFDRDGWCDLYVANDSTPAFLWRNRRDGTFVEVAREAGCAYNGSGVAIAGMGIACADIDSDGAFDLLVTNIVDQSHLALSSRGPRFVDSSGTFALPSLSNAWTGFGVVLFDADHDGALDLYLANGAVSLTPNTVGKTNPYAQPDQFARWNGTRFVDATLGSGAVPDGASRGLAHGDLDADGDLDLVVTANNGRLSVLRNVQTSNHHWLIVDVRLASGSAALGARVEIEVDGKRMLGAVRAHSSYLSSSDPRVHFGLGPHARVERVTVTWSDGSSTAVENVDADRVLSIRHGARR